MADNPKTQMRWDDVVDLQDVLQNYLDKADTFSTRSQRLITGILKRVNVLSQNTLPALNEFMSMSMDEPPIIDQTRNEIVSLGEDMEDWFETLEMLGKEYKGFRDALIDITDKTIEVGHDAD